MRTTLVIFLILLFSFSTNFAQGFVNPKSHYVKPHVRSDGTYVQGHHRTNPNSTNRDNYSTRGNTNPWTNEPGWIPPDNKSLPNSTVTSYLPDLYFQPAENSRQNIIVSNPISSFYPTTQINAAPKPSSRPTSEYNTYSYGLSAGPRVIQYSNGREEFDVVGTSNVAFKKGVTYYSYDIYRREIIESVGSAEGQMLLNGYYKFYDESGVLKMFDTFRNGLKHGMSLRYDDRGGVSERMEYYEGILTYHKFTDEDGAIFELNGNVGKAGSKLLISDNNGLFKKIEFLGNGRDKRYEYLPGTSNIKEEYYTLNNKLDGPCRSFQPDGQTLKAISNYKNDKLEGTYLGYDENGVLRSKFTFSGDVQEGPFEIFNEAKILIQKGYKHGGEPHGQLVTYNDDGSIKFQESYINGVLNGLSKGYRNNKPVYSGTYQAGKKHGRWNYYWLDSSEYFIAQYFNYKNGTLDGAFQEVKGDSVLVGTYKNGLLEGSIKIHQPILLWLFGVPPQKIANDDLLCEGQYSFGKKTGRWKCYDRTQSLVEEGDYLNDLKHGEWRYYFSRYVYENGTVTPYSGKLFLIENYLSGLRNGRSERLAYLTQVPVTCDTTIGTVNPLDTCYSMEYLKVREITYYKNDLLHGPLEWRDEAGGLTRKGEYRLGKMWGVWTVTAFDPMDPDQKYRYEVNYENDQVNGLFQKFDASTNFLLEDGQFKNNLRNEIWNEYFPDGKNRIHMQTHYANGKFNSVKTFTYDGNLVLSAKYLDGNLSFLEHYSASTNKVNFRYKNIRFEDGNYNYDFDIIYGDTITQTHVVLSETGRTEPELDPGFFYAYIELLLQTSPERIYANGPVTKKGKNGILLEEGFIQKGERHGDWKYYFNEQNVLRIIHFDKGKKTSESYVDLKSAKPFSGKMTLQTPEEGGYLIINIRKGLRNGFTLKYNRQGMLIKKTKYKAGEKVESKSDETEH